jgi:hypothetical protein
MMTEFVHCTPIRSGPEFLEALKKAAAAQASDAARLAYEQLAPSMGVRRRSVALVASPVPFSISGVAPPVPVRDARYSFRQTAQFVLDSGVDSGVYPGDTSKLECKSEECRNGLA